MGYVKYIGVWGWLSVSTEAKKYARRTKLGAARAARKNSRESAGFSARDAALESTSARPTVVQLFSKDYSQRNDIPRDVAPSSKLLPDVTRP